MWDSNDRNPSIPHIHNVLTFLEMREEEHMQKKSALNLVGLELKTFYLEGLYFTPRLPSLIWL
jgi:hypothetical protein